MRRRCTLLVNNLLVLGLVLSGQVAFSPLPIETSEARVVTPAGSAQTGDVPTLANTRAKHKQDRRQDLRQDRKRDRAQAERERDGQQKDRKHEGQQGGKPKDGKRDRKRANRAPEESREGNWREFCTGPGGCS